MDFARFDTRGYPTLGVRDGYAAWAPTYEHLLEAHFEVRFGDWALSKSLHHCSERPASRISATFSSGST